MTYDIRWVCERCTGPREVVGFLNKESLPGYQVHITFVRELGMPDELHFYVFYEQSDPEFKWCFKQCLDVSELCTLLTSLRQRAHQACVVSASDSIGDETEARFDIIYEKETMTLN